MAAIPGQRAFQLLEMLHRLFVQAACKAQVAGKDRLRPSSSSEKTIRQVETPDLSRGRILFQN